MLLLRSFGSVLRIPFDRKSVALGFVILFLSILLLNSFGQQSGTLSLKYFPIVTRENEPFVVTALLNNLAAEPQTYGVRIFADGVQVLAGECRLDAFSSQSFTITRAAPKLGSAVRVYAEAVNVETGARTSELVLIPQSPPEAWSSFVAFSAFATSLVSTSTSVATTPSSMRYYLLTLGASGPQALDLVSTIVSPISVGLTVSLTLIGLLMFMEFTDPAFGKTGRRLMQLRSRYGLFAMSLLLIFLGLVFARVVMIIAG